MSWHHVRVRVFIFTDDKHDAYFVGFRTLDFQWLKRKDISTQDTTFRQSDNSNIFIDLNSEVGRIRHSWPIVDRCCVTPPDDFDVKHFDNVDKIPCSIDPNDFYRDYVEKRKVAILLGCQDEWRAKNWTIEGKNHLM